MNQRHAAEKTKRRPQRHLRAWWSYTETPLTWRRPDFESGYRALDTTIVVELKYHSGVPTNLVKGVIASRQTWGHMLTNHIETKYSRILVFNMLGNVADLGRGLSDRDRTRRTLYR